MKYENKINGFIVDSKIELEGVWERIDEVKSVASDSSETTSTPDKTWGLVALKEYALGIGVDASKERSKKAVLALIEEAELELNDEEDDEDELDEDEE